MTLYQPSALAPHELGWVQRNVGHMWDRVELTAASRPCHSLDFFTRQIGCQCPYLNRVKTMVDTSMVRGSQLPPPRSFSVHRVVFTFSRDADQADLYKYAESYVFRFWLDNKWLLFAPLISLQTAAAATAPIFECGFCRCVYAAAARCPNCGAGAAGLVSAGVADVEGGRSFFMDVPIPIHIASLQQFRVTLDAQGDFQHELSRPLGLWCHLEGFTDLAVW